MKILCPSCRQSIDMAQPAQKEPPPTPGNDAWICLWCNATICVYCYWKHTAQVHPKKG